MVNGLMALLIASATLLAGESPVAPQVTVNVRYVAEPEPALLFELRAQQSHVLYESDLPWGNFYSVQLTFHDASGKQVCPLLTRPIDDPSDHQVTLTAGQALSGRVPLLPHCASLFDLRTRGPITVDWAYTPVHRPKPELIHGHVTVPSAK